MMARLKTDVMAPHFCLPDQDETQVCLKDLRGKWVILYFYPKDNTPGCTLEAVQFTAKKAEFDALNSVILGISPDSVKSHCNFIAKQSLTIRLLSDDSREVLKSFGVWGEKKLYGKTFFGVNRTTFLIDPQGIIRSIWEKVKVQGHVDTVLDAVKSVQS